MRASAQELDQDWQDSEEVAAQLTTKLRAVCAFATERCLAIGGRALRLAGAAAVLEGNVLQRIHRDLTVSAQHVMISDVSYEAYGKSVFKATSPE